MPDSLAHMPPAVFPAAWLPTSFTGVLSLAPLAASGIHTVVQVMSSLLDLYQQKFTPTRKSVRITWAFLPGPCWASCAQLRCCGSAEAVRDNCISWEPR